MRVQSTSLTNRVEFNIGILQIFAWSRLSRDEVTVGDEVPEMTVATGATGAVTLCLCGVFRTKGGVSGGAEMLCWDGRINRGL